MAERGFIVVRRAEAATFEALRNEFPLAQGIPVVWDRRHGERRSGRDRRSRGPRRGDRRRADRRGPLPRSWRVQSFVYVAADRDRR